MTAIIDAIGVALLLIGAFLSFAAGVGLVRFPDLLTRMHTATKPQVLGLLLVLIGVELRLFPHVNAGILFLVGLFQLVTIPVVTHMVGRVTYRSGRVREDLLAVDELREELSYSRSE